MLYFENARCEQGTNLLSYRANMCVPPVIEKSVQAEYPEPVGDFNILPDEGVFTNVTPSADNVV